MLPHWVAVIVLLVDEREETEMAEGYDVIVVGARCAGSPTAMLLARKGYRVLVVDRSTFPSDTLSTHLVHPPGVAALRRWGLLDRLTVTGCPPIATYSFDFGPFTVSGSPRPVDGVSLAYAPRRTVLDKLLVDAAVEAGAEVREGFTVEEVLVEGGRVTGIRGHRRGEAAVCERGVVVVGADGRYSAVASAVQAPRYHERPPLEAGYFAYWSGVPTAGCEIYTRTGRSFAAWPTHDGLTLVVVGWPHAELDAIRHDLEGNFAKSLELAPDLARRVAAGRRETRFAGTGDLPNFFRKPYGPGWALVGDAGYHKDPITAQGISDAFCHAELLVDALDAWLSGRRTFDEAMASYQHVRDAEALPMFELTCEMAAMEPPSAQKEALLGAVYGNEEAMDDFVSVAAGTLPVSGFFAPDNVERIFTQAMVRRAS
jgi:2-polyprenyl-6-methoxyphenol hydroxylase-like FAD-dependent oxidoreductase